jgi:hypothetical protein
MPIPFGIPIVYRGQQFPIRKVLAEYLAPLLGKSVGAVAMAVGRYGDEQAIDRLNGVQRRRVQRDRLTGSGTRGWGGSRQPLPVGPAPISSGLSIALIGFIRSVSLA